MSINERVERAKAVASFATDLMGEIEYAERRFNEILDDTPDWERDRRYDDMQKAKIMREVLA